MIEYVTDYEWQLAALGWSEKAHRKVVHATLAEVAVEEDLAVGRDPEWFWPIYENFTRAERDRFWQMVDDQEERNGAYRWRQICRQHDWTPTRRELDRLRCSSRMR